MPDFTHLSSADSVLRANLPSKIKAGFWDARAESPEFEHVRLSLHKQPPAIKGLYKESRSRRQSKPEEKRSCLGRSSLLFAEAGSQKAPIFAPRCERGLSGLHSRWTRSPGELRSSHGENRLPDGYVCAEAGERGGGCNAPWGPSKRPRPFSGCGKYVGDHRRAGIFRSGLHFG